MPKPKKAKRANLGLASTREILLELQARGDVAMVVVESVDLAADGAVLSAMSAAQLSKLGALTLDYRTVDSE